VKSSNLDANGGKRSVIASKLLDPIKNKKAEFLCPAEKERFSRRSTRLGTQPKSIVFLL
jgi:hypothetical protein